MASKVKPKVEKPVAAPLEMVPAPVERQLVLNVSPTVRAFRTYAKLTAKITTTLGKKEGQTDDEAMAVLEQTTDEIINWLTEFGGVTEAEVDDLLFWELYSTMRQAGRAFGAVAIPQSNGTL